jgi:hypothetical protein
LEENLKKFDTRVYSVNDFIEWNTNKQLLLSPDFQRRSVWSEKAKSYLIDTILTGKPIPKVLMTQDLQERKSLRIIIDGQQRIRTIIGFTNDEFKLSKVHNKEYGGLYFSELPDSIKSDYYKYEVGVDILFDISYEDTLDIFARLNTYSVRLNAQELRNATYLGSFKQAAYRIGHRYAKYWKESKILTEQQIARMGEAELASDTLICLIDGIQTNKSIEKYYQQYEEADNGFSKYEKQYDDVMSWIVEVYPAEEMHKTNYHRIQLFYTLFSVFAHSLFGLKGQEKSPKFKLTKNTSGKIRSILDDLTIRYDNDDKSKDIQELIDASRRATTDTLRRKTRFTVLNNRIIQGLQ